MLLENIAGNNNVSACSYKTKAFPQYWASFIGTLTAFALGTTASWSSYALPMLMKPNIKFIITIEQGSWVASVLLLGGLCGALVGGKITQTFGPRRTLQMTAFPLFLSWVVIAYCNTLYGIYIARILAGIAVGTTSVAAPIYLAELADTKRRGRLGSFYPLQITFGMLFGYILGGLLEDFIVLALIPAIIPLIYLIMLSSVPESPIFLARKGEWAQVRGSVLWLKGKKCNIDEEIKKIHQFVESDRKRVRMIDLLKETSTMRALLIAVVLMIIQQLSGINAIVYYTQDIFREAGSSISPPISSMIIGLVQVVATYASTLYIDRLGRRILLLISSSVMSICLLTFGMYFYFKEHYNTTAFAYIPIVSLTIYNVVYALGFGPIPWIIMGEIFNTEAKGPASSIVATVNWLLAFIVTKFFANLIDLVGNFITFTIFALVCLFGILYVYYFVPETKGKEIEEIIIELEKK